MTEVVYPKVDDIKDRRILSVVNRLLSNHNKLRFKNIDGDINTEIRTCKLNEETYRISFEIITAHDNELENIVENDGINGSYDTEYDYEVLDEDIIEDFKDAYKKYRNLKRCGCQKHFITDGKCVCEWCELIASFECDICKDICDDSTITCCCNKEICVACYEKVNRCPFCRAREF